MRFWRSFSDFYKLFALMALNTLVFFVLFNAMLLVAYRVKDRYISHRATDPIAVLEKAPELREVYPGMDADTIHRLLVETWSRTYMYEPFTQFTERPFTGEFVNVSEFGFRWSRDQGPWPPEPKHYTIFLFGGSTAFGYGVADDQTVASHVQQRLADETGLDVRAYNFGRSSYMSSQERVLFENLLLGGVAPDMAIFLDGLNEFAFHEGPAYSKRLEKAFNWRKTSSVADFVNQLPMARFAAYVKRKMTTFAGQDPRPVGAEVVGNEAYNDPAVIDEALRRYMQNKRLIETVANEYGVHAVFVWQPIPLYKYDLEYHLFGDDDFGTNYYAAYGYAHMAKLAAEGRLGENFLWCADIQERLREPLYVDRVHYTGKASALIAATIIEILLDSDLIDINR